MRDFIRVVFAGGLAVAMVAGRPDSGAAQTAQAPGAVPVVQLPPQFAGVWDYNAAESVNIVTGRPEQSPRNAVQRGAPVAPNPQPTLGRSTAAQAGGGTSEPSSLMRAFAPSPQMMREARDMARDLLEVPEAFTIVIGENSITFTDDIDRARTYPVDGRREKYLLGASQFNARLMWNGIQLRKEIEGAFGFRMSETYFLSPDARRLFVMIRVGTPGRNKQLLGFNRVYDRVDAEQPVAQDQENERVSLR